MSLRTHISADYLRGLLSETHLNFLIGAGASSPAIPLLGEIERLSASPAMTLAADGPRRVAQAALDAHFLRNVLGPNISDQTNPVREKVAEGYESFADTLNRILLERRSPLLPKRASLFTTNQDLFLEGAFDAAGLEIRDGFRGRYEAVLRMDQMSTRLFRVDNRYETTAEVPTFSLYKLHGSVNWRAGEDGTILLDSGLAVLQRAIDCLDATGADILPIPADDDVETLLTQVDVNSLPALAEFMECYDSLAVVNPTKEKFAKTVMLQQYYEQLRSLSNELERENSVLFVLGFSFRDEHIRRLVCRALNSNPTLIVYVFCYDETAVRAITESFAGESLLFDNLKLVGPTEFGEGVASLDIPTVTRLLAAATSSEAAA